MPQKSREVDRVSFTLSLLDKIIDSFLSEDGMSHIHAKHICIMALVLIKEIKVAYRRSLFYTTVAMLANVISCISAEVWIDNLMKERKKHLLSDFSDRKSPDSHLNDNNSDDDAAAFSQAKETLRRCSINARAFANYLMISHYETLTECMEEDTTVMKLLENIFAKLICQLPSSRHLHSAHLVGASIMERWKVTVHRFGSTLMASCNIETDWFLLNIGDLAVRISEASKGAKEEISPTTTEESITKCSSSSIQSDDSWGTDFTFEHIGKRKGQVRSGHRRKKMNTPRDSPDARMICSRLIGDMMKQPEENCDKSNSSVGDTGLMRESVPPPMTIVCDDTNSSISSICSHDQSSHPTSDAELSVDTVESLSPHYSEAKGDEVCSEPWKPPEMERPVINTYVESKKRAVTYEKGAPYSVHHEERGGYSCRQILNSPSVMIQGEEYEMSEYEHMWRQQQYAQAVALAEDYQYLSHCAFMAASELANPDQCTRCGSMPYVHESTNMPIPLYTLGYGGYYTQLCYEYGSALCNVDGSFVCGAFDSTDDRFHHIIPQPHCYYESSDNYAHSSYNCASNFGYDFEIHDVYDVIRDGPAVKQMDTSPRFRRRSRKRRHRVRQKSRES